MSGMRRKILWVDDEIEFLRSHIMFLETRGYSVFPVYSGDEAVRLIKENPSVYDIVLLDEQMPGKSGLAALDEIREIEPDLPVIMITGNQKEQAVETALGKKIDAYLIKPVNPNQILLCCKRILDSKRLISTHLSEKYLRKFTENNALLNSFLNVSDWINLYESLVKWDLKLEEVDNEGLRQMHAGQKSDCNKRFGSFVSENYAQWITGGQSKPALMSNDIVEKVAVPRLRNGHSVLMVVLSGMRLDQFLMIEPELKEHFSVNSLRFVSSLPTSYEFCRTSLVSGEYPQTVSELIPGIFEGKVDMCNEDVMTLLTRHGLKRLGVEGVDTFYINANGLSEGQQLNAIVNSLRKEPTFGVVALDVINQFLSISGAGNLFKEGASDDVTFRGLVKFWFINSVIMKLVKEASNNSCTVILTSDHGHILCSRSAEIYGRPKINSNRRYLSGKKLSADERNVLFLEEPSYFKLPGGAAETKWLMARENYYFIYPEKFGHYQKQCLNCFQYGGISLEEMIMPLYIF
ncbi:MAG: bifunctional response regulator/alkaline phosphatase family protein [Chitinispirillales bacterium]|jgi:CheY-like chemotaxis protein|nr:bifunctional response regulator/alkaline phosphatase family protein [Chitinispirillales bacterium]